MLRRRSLVVMLFATFTLGAAMPHAAATAAPVGAEAQDSGDDDAPRPGSNDADGDIPDDAFTIIGTPDAGPAPEDAGDRGGWAQFAVLGALVAGVGFVFWRIASSARAAQRQPGAG